MENKEIVIDEKDFGKSQGVLRQAFHFAKIPVIISFLLTPVRFLLELAGLPKYAIFLSDCYG